MGKQQSVIQGLQLVAHFFEKISIDKTESSKSLKIIGVPSKSFLSAHAHSMLFDSEIAIFNNQNLDDTSLSNRGTALFCEIREKY